MSDISERITLPSQIKRDDGEYKLQPRHFIPKSGLDIYLRQDCPLPIQDMSFFERFSLEEQRTIENKRRVRAFRLIVYNSALYAGAVGGGLIAGFASII